MDSISSNEYASSGSQSHHERASYIGDCNLFAHFADSTSQDRPKSKRPFYYSSPNNNGNSINASSTCTDICSAILGSHQHQSAMDKTSVAFTTSACHPNEPPTSDERYPAICNPVDSIPHPRHALPSVPSKSLRHHLHHSYSTHSLQTSPTNYLEPSQNQSVVSPASSLSLAQSELLKLLRKSGCVISAEEIKEANNSSQLYLLVPSNYPVLMTVVTGHEKVPVAARNLLERFQLDSSSPMSQQQEHSTPTHQMLAEQQSQPQNVTLRAPRKNSTNIPPILLQSLKGIVPSLAFGGSASTSSTITECEEGKMTSDAPPQPLTSSPQQPQMPPSRSASSSFHLDEYRASGDPNSEVKTKTLALSTSSASTSGQSVDAGPNAESVLANDSTVFFSSNSPPPRHYMGRIGGGHSFNRAGGDTKDIRRRVSHNEIERRRRDRINTWIAELYKLLPSEQQAKSQYQSKGVVLKRVCEYFQNYDSTLKAVQEENAAFKQEVCRLTQENRILRNSLNAHFQQQQQQSSVVPAMTPSTAECTKASSHFSDD